MTQLPALPNDISPNEPVVEFAMIHCRTCGEESGWKRVPEEEEEIYSWYSSGHKHGALLGSGYRFQITRGTVR